MGWANSRIFETPANTVVVHDVAVALRNAQRQGNHETKTRAHVSGGGIKPYRQKGTGNARHGSTREPQMKGGGSVWGPHKRSYRQNVSIQLRRQALCVVLSERVRKGVLRILDNLAFEAPKTKDFAAMATRLAPGKGKTLFIMAEVDTTVLMSARNLPRVNVCTAMDLNVLDVLDAGQVVIVQDALSTLGERLANMKIGKEREQ